MLVQYWIASVYFAIITAFSVFILTFYWLSRKPSRIRNPTTRVEENPRGFGMKKKERNWLYLLLAIAVLGNLVTLLPIIPAATNAIWSDSVPGQTIKIEVSNYTFTLPQNPITIVTGKLVEFVVVSHDVTYGFGVFRKDGTLVFQMQVVPLPHVNTIKWVFDQAGYYDIRSTEYSGPQHPSMHLADSILVAGA